MLFNPVGKNKPLRVQGTFISETEVNRVVDFLKSNNEDVKYSEDVIDKLETTDKIKTSGEDELLEDAIDVIFASGQASASMLQRRFRIGYNRAARLIELLEEKNLIGPQDGSRPRQVLMTRAQYEEMQEEDDE